MPLMTPNDNPCPMPHIPFIRLSRPISDLLGSPIQPFGLRFGTLFWVVHVSLGLYIRPNTPVLHEAIECSGVDAGVQGPTVRSRPLESPLCPALIGNYVHHFSHAFSSYLIVLFYI